MGLAAWMLVAMEAWECWPSDYIGLHGSRGPIRSLLSWNPQNLMTEPGGLQACRLAAWMVILQESVCRRIRRESWPYSKFAILEPPKSDDCA